MSNVLMNNLSAAVYHGLVILTASAILAQRVRGRTPRAALTWR